MKKHRCLVVTPGVGLLAMTLSVAAQNVGGAERPLTLEEARVQLEELRILSKDSTQRNLVTIYESVRQASASTSAAVDFYIDAIMKVNFSGLTKENTKLRDWRIKNEGELNDRNYREALRLHLAYLALSLKRAADPEPKSWLGDLRAFSNRILDLDEKILAVKPWMNQPLGSTVIAQAYGIDKLLPEPAKWEMVPSNADGMIERTILPLLLEARDPEVIDYWDKRIRRELKRSADADRTFEKQMFEQIRLPELYCWRAQDLQALGRSQEALSEMLKIMRTYPAHPSFSNWLKQAEQAVSGWEPKNEP